MSEGGLAGYIAAYEQAKLSAQTPFHGMGRAMMIAETFPIVAFMMFAIAMRRRGRPLPAAAMLGAFAALLALCVLFGGLRGSRSNTVWVIFWAAMVTHCWLRPLGRRSLVGGMLLLVAFMYGYGLYKGVRGAEGLSDLWQGRVSLSELEERTEKPLSKVLLTDFGRGDIQALILQRIATGAFEPVARTHLPRRARDDRAALSVARAAGQQAARGLGDAFRPRRLQRPLRLALHPRARRRGDDQLRTARRGPRLPSLWLRLRPDRWPAEGRCTRTTRACC